jgi:protein TonB
MKRLDISGLKSGYFMRFQIGIIIALAATIAAFNFTTYPAEAHDVGLVFIDEWIDEDIPITYHVKEKPKVIPPPTIELNDEIEPIEGEPEFIENEPVEKIETVVQADEKIVYVAPKPKKAKVIKKPEIVEPEFQEIDVEEIVTFTDEMPRFNACEDIDGGNKEKEKCANQALVAYVLGNIKYPRMALENGITGTVVIQFIVEKDGSISGAKIARDIGGGCGAEALRVVKTLPAWIPGKQRSRPVRVKFSLPVKFNAI